MAKQHVTTTINGNAVEFLCESRQTLLDVLRDDSLKLAAALTTAGICFRLDYVPGATHGFLRFGNAADASRNALSEAGRYLASVI